MLVNVKAVYITLCILCFYRNIKQDSPGESVAYNLIDPQVSVRRIKSFTYLAGK